MDHPTQLSWALRRRRSGPIAGRYRPRASRTFATASFARIAAAFRIEIGNDGWSWPTGAPITTAAELARQGLRGKALDDALRDQASRHIRLASLVEQLPDPENRVTLDAQREGYLRRAAAAPCLSARRLCQSRPLRRPRRPCGDLRRLGATEIQHRHVAEGAGHIIGTARMGNDPKTSVVDRDLRSHDHPNLFILGSAVFPTSATANPTLTIAALSLRAADR